MSQDPPREQTASREFDPLMDPGEFFVRWTAENAARFPGLVDAVAAFDAGALPAAQAAGLWLRQHALRSPQESATSLYVKDGGLVGFYALANGQAELRASHRKALGVERPTQPAVVLTWIAKSARHTFSGLVLVEHAIEQARRVAEHSAATVFALDPFDEPTAEMWRREYGFRNAAKPGAGRDLPRLWLPLSTDD